jgi:hypothetical protein
MGEQPRVSADHLLEPATGLMRTPREFAEFPLSPTKYPLIEVIKDETRHDI